MRPHPSHMMVGLSLSNFTVGATPPSTSASGPYDGSSKTTPSVTVAQVTGPGGSLTFSWSHISGDAAITVNSPTAATTTFTANPGESVSLSAVKRCTVLNSFGQTAVVDVTVAIAAGLAAIVPHTSPNGFATSHSNASNFTQVVTCAPTCIASAGPFTEAWSAGGGAMSPSSGTSSTLTMTPGGVGNTTFATIACNVTDGAGRSGIENQTYTVTWT